MRRLPLAAVAAAAVLTLAACTSAPAPSGSASASAAPSTAATAVPSSSAPASSAPPSSAPASAAPAPSASGSPEQRYLTFVQQFSPTLAKRNASTLLALGHHVCDGFAAGKSASQVAVALDHDSAAPDLNAEDASVIIGAGVAVLCPKYRSKLEG